MRRPRIAHLLAVACLLAVPGLAWGQEGAGEPKEGAEETPPPEAPAGEGQPGQAEGAPQGFPEPAFRSPKGEEAYRAGLKLFQEGNYTEAANQFKKAREHLKAATERPALAVWSTACEGGLALDAYRKQAEKGSVRQVYFMAMDQWDRHRSGPLGPRVSAFLDEFGPRVLQVLESFDRPSRRYAAKYGKTFVKDPALVFRGSHSLQWTSTKDGKMSQLQITEVPRRWTGFHSVVFWVKSDRSVDLELLALSPGQTKDESNVMQVAYTPPARPGWVRAEVELARFSKYGAGSFTNVESLVIQAPAKASFKIYLDEVCLVRKDDGGATAAGDTKEDEGAKKAKKTSGASKSKKKS